MQKANPKRPLILLTIAASLMSGCIPQMVMKSQDRQHYSEYVTETQRLNLEREKANLAPIKVMTFEEWGGGK